MQFDWLYLHLRADGRLVDNETGEEVNENWPSFDTEEQAEQWLSDNNMRANVC